MDNCFQISLEYGQLLSNIIGVWVISFKYHWSMGNFFQIPLDYGQFLSNTLEYL